MTLTMPIVMTCLFLGGVFLFLTLVFFFLKEKAAKLISGFNTIPKAEKEKYNQVAMAQDMRNSIALWSVILLVGALLSYLVSFVFGIIAFILWLILFFKNVSH